MFAETVTAVTIQLQVDEIDDDNGNDTDLVIDEDIIETKDVIMPQVELNEGSGNEDKDIQLSQIKHSARMVKYRASTEDISDSESDEFDSSTPGEREIEVTLEVVRYCRGAP